MPGREMVRPEWEEGLRLGTTRGAAWEREELEEVPRAVPGRLRREWRCVG